MLASVSAPRATPAPSSPMPSSGSSPVASPTAPATPALTATTPSAASPMPSSPRPRPVPGTRPTSRCFSTMPTPRSRKTELKFVSGCGMTDERKVSRVASLLPSDVGTCLFSLGFLLSSLSVGLFCWVLIDPGSCMWKMSLSVPRFLLYIFIYIYKFP